MLREFDAWLHRAAELVVVGYSFRDEHINGILRRRIAGDPTFQVTIVDPALEGVLERYRFNADASFRDELLGALTDYESVTDADGIGHAQRRCREMLRLVPQGACEGLADVFGEAPAVKPSAAGPTGQATPHI
ncbi:hypothetical protein GCM10028801_46370 [Nocardioides maradonensis]